MRRIEAAGSALDVDESDVRVDGGVRVADRLAEGEALAEPGPGMLDVTALEHDLAEQESDRRLRATDSDPKPSGEDPPGSRLGLVQCAHDEVELDLGDEAEGVDIRGLFRSSR